MKIKIPEKLEFGNMEHIKAVRQAEKEKLIEENKEELIKKHWVSHNYCCDSCGSDVSHDGDKEPDFQVKFEDGKTIITMYCTEGEDCDEYVEVTI